MNFSYSLVEQLKIKLNLKSDLQVCEVIPKTTSGNLSQVKSGKRHLTEDQALWIAEQCGLNLDWVLVNLAEETAKSDKAKSVWHKLAKKMVKAVSAVGILTILMLSQGSGQSPSQRFKYIP